MKTSILFIKKILLLSVLLCLTANAQKVQRPFIWVTKNDRAKILNKIETQAWANAYYKEFKERLDDDISSYKKSPNDFLIKIPFDWSKQKTGTTPPLLSFMDSNEANSSERTLQFKYLQIGIDCGVMYYLTEDENYAQCALDILHAYVEGLLQVKPSDELGNGGWLYPTDHLREARVIGAQIPIIYDFIAPYLESKKKAYDIGKKDFTEFSEQNAQKVFLTYATLAAEHGNVGTNWSVLESFSLVQNTLALNDLAQRKTFLEYYLTTGTKKQESLSMIAERYKNDGDVFPETSQYSNDVANFSTRLMILLNKYDPSLELGKKYYKIPFSLDRWTSIRYPNNQIIRFGDGQRSFNTPYRYYDMAYLLGKQNNVDKITNKFGPLLTQGIKSGEYKREKVGERLSAITIYYAPTELLWIDETKEYSLENTVLPRTDTFSHAGIFLQRNLSTTDKPEDGLMCFVGGGHMVHGHASGMDMELYGLGKVLGADHGHGSYRTDLHENYSRLFAAHNTIIVNGASQGEGGWVQLGMNSTQLVAMEPMPLKAAMSPNHSFTRTSFLDDKGDKAEAKQERTLALIRTSPTTGYYVDVFRSKSILPNEFHDYLYHNIGDELKFHNKDLAVKPDDQRYMANANVEWKQNLQFKNPGWHFFKNVESSNAYESDVKATFEINQNSKKQYMNLFIAGNKNREYTKVMAPKTFEAPKPYDNLPTPTLVIRQKGEAWSNPFSVIYEPTYDSKSTEGIQTVTKIEKNGAFIGFKVTSMIKKELITQYIISQPNDSNYTNKEFGFNFTGAFAVITYNEKSELQSIYIGEGKLFKNKNYAIKSKDGKQIAAYIDFSTAKNEIKASENAEVLFLKK
jgi:Heparinase II/III-like protein